MSNRYHRVYVESIASICHEAARAICEASGDMSEKPWDEADISHRQSAIYYVQFRLSFPDDPVGSRHEVWRTHKIADGWTYGPVKDTEAKTDPRIVPFDDLPFEHKVGDYVVHAIVAALR